MGDRIDTIGTKLPAQTTKSPEIRALDITVIGESAWAEMNEVLRENSGAEQTPGMKAAFALGKGAYVQHARLKKYVKAVWGKSHAKKAGYLNIPAANGGAAVAEAIQQATP